MDDVGTPEVFYRELSKRCKVGLTNMTPQAEYGLIEVERQIDRERREAA